MKSAFATPAFVLLVLATALPAHAETCASGPAAQRPSGKSDTTTDKGAPATVGKDGVAGTGWTGGTGGLMAGTENEKPGQNPDSQNPNVAKGLDPTKDKSPSKPTC